MTESRDLITRAKAAMAGLPGGVRRRQAVLSCMDARVDPWRIFDAGPGDLNVIRNAGGIVTADVIRSLVVSQHALGTSRIDVVMHTDCGLHRLDEAELASAIRAATGAAVAAEFGGFEDLEAELERGVAVLRSTEALLHRDQVRGHVFDVETGRLHTVVT